KLKDLPPENEVSANDASGTQKHKDEAPLPAPASQGQGKGLLAAESGDVLASAKTQANAPEDGRKSSITQVAAPEDGHISPPKQVAVPDPGGASESIGISSAQKEAQMKNSEKMDKTAGTAEQFLPSDTLGENGKELAPTAKHADFSVM